jgi:hypothetical protein
MRVCKGREKKALPNSGDVHNLTAHTYNVTNDQGEEGSKTIGVEHLLLSDFGNFADSLIANLYNGNVILLPWERVHEIYSPSVQYQGPCRN